MSRECFAVCGGSLTQLGFLPAVRSISYGKGDMRWWKCENCGRYWFQFTGFGPFRPDPGRYFTGEWPHEFPKIRTQGG